MPIIKRKWELISKDRRTILIKRDQEIGVIAAEDILDFFLEALGENIYNRAINDSKNTIKQSFENLEIDLELLLNK